MLVLFDLDETLLDSLEAWLQAYLKVPETAGLPEEEIITSFFVRSEAAFERNGITDLNAFYSTLFNALKEGGRVKVMENAEETVAQLKKEGHKLGVVTSRNKSVARLHCPQSLLDKLDVFVDRDDARPKPAPDGILKAYELAGVAASQAVFVGDHSHDLQCAKAAGVPFFFFRHADDKFQKHLKLDAAVSFSDFRELPGLVQRPQGR